MLDLEMRLDENVMYRIWRGTAILSFNPASTTYSSCKDQSNKTKNSTVSSQAYKQRRVILTKGSMASGSPPDTE